MAEAGRSPLQPASGKELHRSTGNGVLRRHIARPQSQHMEINMAWIEESELPDVPAIFQAMSLKPEALDVVKRLNEVLSFGNSGLSRVQEEAIATVVSVANRCRYGAMTHAGFLRRHSQDLEMASHFLSDYTQAPLSSTDRRILDFAVRITQVPSALTENDVEQLRDAGLEESQILDVVLVACLSNFMDRLANSLGVDLEPRHRRALENWLTGPAAQQDWLMSSPSQSPPATPTKAKLSVANGKAAPGNESPPKAPILPKEDFVDPVPETELPMSTDLPFALEDQIDSGILTSGSVSTQETSDDGRLEDVIAEQTGGEDEASLEPHSEIPENPLEEDAAGEKGGGEPENSAAEEPEPSPVINVNPLFGRFVEECCETADGQTATARELYIAYLRWCDENDQQPLRQRDFGINLSEMGFIRQRKARGRHWWIGIALIAEDDKYIKDVHNIASPTHRIN